MLTITAVNRRISGVPVARLITSREGRDELRQFLQAFKDDVVAVCPGWCPSAVLFTDACVPLVEALG